MGLHVFGCEARLRLYAQEALSSHEWILPNSMQIISKLMQFKDLPKPSSSQNLSLSKQLGSYQPQ